jgi:uncharacterized spore protein YtfJ
MAENGANVANAATEANAATGRARDRAFKKASDAGEGGVAGLLAGMAERIGATARVSAVFGEPVEKDGRTVIPVAQSMWGSGAGSGMSEQEGSGSGGGGGAITRPLGYIEVTDQGASFVPLAKPWQDAKLVLAWAVAIWVASRALNRILRG